jgi:hypothetical protein
MPKIILLSFLFQLFSNYSYSLVSDGYHTIEDYIQLAYTDPSFEGACFIEHYELSGTITQTGVLIHNNIVATAGHGVVKILNKNKNKNSEKETIIPLKTILVTFKTEKGIKTYRSDAVLIDSRYLENRQGAENKYDIAFIRLKEPVLHIKHAILLEKIEIDNDDLLTVVTFGSVDLPFHQHLIKRAFCLFEIDHHYTPDDDEHFLGEKGVILSSIFFKPSLLSKQPLKTSDEITLRSYEATQNWKKHKKLPYGLALPGTSGAPVFIKKEKSYLLGLVTSYAGLIHRMSRSTPEHDLILRSSNRGIGEYQTNFILFYKEHKNIFLDSDLKGQEKIKYILDPELSEKIKHLRNYPASPESSLDKLDTWFDNYFDKIKNKIIQFFKDWTASKISL